MFDFDRVINRRGTHATKWDNMAKLSGIDAPDAIPMWVADMDFAAPPGVTEALMAMAQRGVYGYYGDTGSWAAALAEWLQRRHNLAIDPAWVSPTPGVVAGLGLILQAASEPGDEVVVFPPAYHAFRRIIVANERRILDAQLVESNGRYVMDLDALRAKLTPRTKVVFFCSPHNPGGTVWSPEEIRALARFCIEHDLLLVSDEIHCDLVFAGAEAYAHPDRRARDRRPPRHHFCGDQDLQPGWRSCRRLRHLQRGAEARHRCAHHGERARLLQQRRDDRDRGGLAHRRGVARRAAGVSDGKPRPVRPAHRGRGTRRALDAARLYLSGLGGFFRHRPAARRGRGPREEPGADLCEPRPTVRTGRRIPGCASTLPRRGRSWRKRWAGWTRRSNS